MPRTPAEIDAARRAEAITVLASEVRAFPPGFQEGGKLKLNTNYQVEIAPVAINVAGRDVQIGDTHYIDDSDWNISGVTTPKIPGSWYYLYIQDDGTYHISANEPEYNNQWFGYYHPIVTNARNIGKFWFGAGSYPIFVQSKTGVTRQQVLVAASTYTGEDADYYCIGKHDEILIMAAADYLRDVYDGGKIIFSEGTFQLDDNCILNGDLSLEGNNQAIITTTNGNYYLGLTWGTTTEHYKVTGFIFSNSTLFITQSLVGSIVKNLIVNKNSFINNAVLTVSGNIKDAVITQNYMYQGLNFQVISADYSIISDNIIEDSFRYFNADFDPAMTITPVYFSGTRNHIMNNICYNNGNLIDRNTCDNSSTSPMIFGEAAPTASNGTWGFTATSPYEGTGQYRFSKTAAAGTIAYLHLVDNVGAADVHGLIPGTQYEFSAYLKSYASSSGGYQGLRIYQATTGGGAASTVAFSTATNGWQQVLATATIYANATTAYISFVASASLGNTHYFDVDNIRLFPPGVTNVHNQNYYDGGINTYDGL